MVNFNFTYGEIANEDGKRLLFDFMLPEPAAFLLYAFGNQPKAGADLAKPVPFTKKPTDISEWNYPADVQKYEVTGVTAPPQPYTTVAKAVDGKGTKDDGVTKILEIVIPDGYEAVGYEWVSRYTYWDDGTLDVVLLPEPYGSPLIEGAPRLEAAPATEAGAAGAASLVPQSTE